MPKQPVDRQALRQRQREAKLAAHAAARAAAGRRTPITVDRILDTALSLVAEEGYEALTMRRVAAALGTGPASLYAHVVDKAHLDELLMGRLCAAIVLPAPDPQAWRSQLIDVCVQLRDEYLRYPGISRAGLAMVPTNSEALRISEGMLGILLAGGVSPQAAAWGIDSLTLYIDAYCLELSLWVDELQHADGGWMSVHTELLHRFAALPDDQFPLTRKHAAQLTAGRGHDRFDFTLGLMIDGLASSSAAQQSQPARPVQSTSGRSRARAKRSR